MRPTPAITVATVRTIGTKRPIRIVHEPNRSKKWCERSTYSGRNIREFGLSNTTGPAR